MRRRTQSFLPQRDPSPVPSPDESFEDFLAREKKPLVGFADGVGAKQTQKHKPENDQFADHQHASPPAVHMGSDEAFDRYLQSQVGSDVDTTGHRTGPNAPSKEDTHAALTAQPTGTQKAARPPRSDPAVPAQRAPPRRDIDMPKSQQSAAPNASYMDTSLDQSLMGSEQLIYMSNMTHTDEGRGTGSPGRERESTVEPGAKTQGIDDSRSPYSDVGSSSRHLPMQTQPYGQDHHDVSAYHSHDSIQDLYHSDSDAYIHHVEHQFNPELAHQGVPHASLPRLSAGAAGHPNHHPHPDSLSTDHCIYCQRILTGARGEHSPLCPKGKMLSRVSLEPVGSYPNRFIDSSMEDLHYREPDVYTPPNVDHVSYETVTATVPQRSSAAYETVMSVAHDANRNVTFYGEDEHHAEKDDKLQAVYGQFEEFRAQVKEEQMQVAEQATQFRTQIKELESQVTASKKKEDELTHRLNTLQMLKDQMEAKIAQEQEARQEFEAAGESTQQRLDDAKQTIKELEGRIKRREEEFALVQSQLDSVKMENIKIKDREEKIKLEVQDALYRKSVIENDLQETAKQLKTTTLTLRQLTVENDATKRELQLAKQAQSTTQRQMDHLNDTILNLKDDLAQQARKQQQIITTNERVEKENNTLRAALTIAETKTRQLEETIQDLRTELTTMKKAQARNNSINSARPGGSVVAGMGGIGVGMGGGLGAPGGSYSAESEGGRGERPVAGKITDTDGNVNATIRPRPGSARRMETSFDLFTGRPNTGESDSESRPVTAARDRARDRRSLPSSRFEDENPPMAYRQKQNQVIRNSTSESVQVAPAGGIQFPTPEEIQTFQRMVDFYQSHARQTGQQVPSFPGYPAMSVASEQMHPSVAATGGGGGGSRPASRTKIDNRRSLGPEPIDEPTAGSYSREPAVRRSSRPSYQENVDYFSDLIGPDSEPVSSKDAFDLYHITEDYRDDPIIEPAYQQPLQRPQTVKEQRQRTPPRPARLSHHRTDELDQPVVASRASIPRESSPEPPAPPRSARPSDSAPPYAVDMSTQAERVRIANLERELMHIQMSKNQLELEYSKLPQTGGKTIQQRKRKQELEDRIAVLDKEASKLKTQLREANKDIAR
eukprot:GILK01012346.1.p1 GENE.GILK01012346.1~~GILK01012346.1.p1  ORF type:complete len:1117 (+),score=224.74 GILK01012346.1:131-3481(+)